MTSLNRPLTNQENALVRWLLENGKPEAAPFLQQLPQVSVTPWKCQCGCASINFVVQGNPEQSGGLNPLADFLFGSESDLSGIFVYEQAGVLAGLEVYGLTGEASKVLPSIDALRPWSDAAQSA